MQIAIREEEIVCDYCLSILLSNGECPYCGRKDDEED